MAEKKNRARTSESVPNNVKIGDIFTASQGAAESPRDMTYGYPDMRKFGINGENPRGGRK